MTNTLEITANEKIDLVDKNEFLISSFNDLSGKKIIYRMNFENKEELQKFKGIIEKNKGIEKINIIYNK